MSIKKSQILVFALLVAAASATAGFAVGSTVNSPQFPTLTTTASPLPGETDVVPVGTPVPRTDLEAGKQEVSVAGLVQDPSRYEDKAITVVGKVAYIAPERAYYLIGGENKSILLDNSAYQKDLGEFVDQTVRAHGRAGLVKDASGRPTLGIVVESFGGGGRR